MEGADVVPAQNVKLLVKIVVITPDVAVKVMEHVIPAVE